MEISISRFLWFRKQADTLYDSMFLSAAKECGLTVPEAQVLCYLQNNPALDTARDMAYYRGFSKAYISRALEPLLAKKMIAISTDPSDRRLQHLRLTETALGCSARLQQAQKEFIKVLTTGLNPEETETLGKLLEKLSAQSLSQEETHASRK